MEPDPQGQNKAETSIQKLRGSSSGSRTQGPGPKAWGSAEGPGPRHSAPKGTCSQLTGHALDRTAHIAAEVPRQTAHIKAQVLDQTAPLWPGIASQIAGHWAKFRAELADQWQRNCGQFCDRLLRVLPKIATFEPKMPSKCPKARQNSAKAAQLTAPVAAGIGKKLWDLRSKLPGALARISGRVAGQLAPH